MNKRSSKALRTRLEKSLFGIPAPASFREAAICLRSLIKERIEAGDSPRDLLLQLHDLAAYNEFLFGHGPTALDHRGHTMPAVNVSFHAHEAGVRDCIDLGFSTIGHVRLSLLNKTDRKRIAEYLGPTPTHISPAEKYSEFWDLYHKAFNEKRRQWERDLWKSL